MWLMILDELVKKINNQKITMPEFFLISIHAMPTMYLYYLFFSEQQKLLSLSPPFPLIAVYSHHLTT